MGMNVGSGDSHGVKSDINVTPLVDVVLVLLIIFLVTMPVVMRTVTLEVPRSADEHEQVPVASKTIIVTVLPDLMVNVSDGVKDDRVINSLELTHDLRQVFESRSGEKVVFVDFCADVPWQEVVSTMDRVRGVASPESMAIKDRRDAGNSVKVALKKKDKKSQRNPEKPSPCPEER